MSSLEGTDSRCSLIVWRLAMSYVPVFLLFLFGFAFAQYAFVSNLDSTCLKCICTAFTGCNGSVPCSSEDFYGPFCLSRIYWENAGSITLGLNSRGSDDGFKSCAKNFQCASRVISNYMAYNAWDCTEDGVTDCDDYMRLHFIGPERCTEYIENTREYQRYLSCRPPKATEDFSLLKK